VTWARISARRRARTGVAVNKYGAVKTVLDGIRFDSKREADRYARLRVLALAGHITNLQHQVSYDLHAMGGVKVARYVADFVYRDERTQRLVVEDVKGVKTRMFQLKAKWLKAEHGIEVQCV
jgi:hypothetical protein